MKSHVKQFLHRFKWPLTASAVVLVLILALAHPRQGKASATGSDMTDVPSVAVTKVGREDLYKEITIPAEFRPYTEVELHAKVAGYVEKMNVDFGDKVKAGELLATLEVPELQDELNNAIAIEKRAEADHTDAHLVYTRLLAVNKEHPNLVAQQDLDTAESKDASTDAALAAAKADMDKYQTLVAYTKITAPFDGVVTKRYADPGALIQSGTASQTQTMPLVRLSDNYRLRLDFPVSVDYVKDIEVGDQVDVRIESLGGKMFSGKISRFTHEVDSNTRTMMTETEVENPKLEIAPGMYAIVVLKVERSPHALAIPIQAVESGGKSVYIVNKQNEVEERAVTLGLETPSKYEVLSGLNEGDLVMIGNPGQVKPGQKVEPKLTEMDSSFAQQ